MVFFSDEVTVSTGRWFCGVLLSDLCYFRAFYQSFVESPSSRCIFAQSVTMIIAAGGKIDRVNRWSLLSEMKLQ